jgi:hypothetical protein
MQEEFQALIQNNTWHLVPLADGLNVIDCKCTTTLVTFCDVVFMSPNLKFMSLFKIYDISMTKITSSPIMRGIA